MKFNRHKMIMMAVATVALSTTAQALTPRTGEYTCGRLPDRKYECLNVIKGKFVDEWASAACDRIPDINYTINCMRDIAGHQFHTKAVFACDRILGTLETIQCLNTIRGCDYTDAAVRECDALESVEQTIMCLRYYCSL